jgi:hypothetical protein
VIGKLPISRRNWYKQQVIKWIAAAENDVPCLVIDSELILFAPRLWVNEFGVQVHYLLNDLNPQYIVSCEKLFKCRLPKVDFVSHGALFQQDVLRSLSKGNMNQFLLEWLNSGYTRFHGSPICEWQTYASYLALIYPSRLRIGFQGQPIVSDNLELHKLNYLGMRNKFGNNPAIYLGHKDKVH